MAVWTINNATTEALKVSGLRLSYAMAEEDRTTFIEDGPDFDAGPLFNYLDEVTIKKDGYTVFQGVVTGINPVGTGSSESKQYTVSGPWYYFNHTIFLQDWEVWENDAEVMRPKSRAVLGRNPNGDRVNAEQVIRDAVGLAQGPGRFNIGTIDIPGNVLWDEALDQTCAEVVIKMLQWAPDAVCWFDYSGGTPTFHCRRRHQLNGVTINIENGLINTCNVIPRYDLQAPGVVIRYERIDTFDDKEREVIEYDVYPSGTNPLDLNVINMTVALQGSVTTIQRQHIKVTDLTGKFDSDKEWWRERVPWLQAYPAEDLSFDEAERSGEEEYHSELLEGNILEWMPVNWEEETITALVSYRDPDGNILGEKVPIQVQLIATDGLSITYRKPTIEERAEEKPEGLAQQYFNAINPLQYEGQLVITEDEVSDSDYLGKRLNLSNGKGEWQSMDAMITTFELDIDTGTTSLQYGPPPHIRFSDLVEHHRMNRNKVIVRFSSSDSEVDHGGVSPLRNATTEPSAPSMECGFHPSIDPEDPTKLIIGEGYFANGLHPPTDDLSGKINGFRNGDTFVAYLRWKIRGRDDPGLFDLDKIKQDEFVHRPEDNLVQYPLAIVETDSEGITNIKPICQPLIIVETHLS